MGRRALYKWTDEQEQFVINQYGKMTVKGIAVALRMSEKQVISKAQTLERNKLITRKKNKAVERTYEDNLTREQVRDFSLQIGTKYRIQKRNDSKKYDDYITGIIVDITDRLVIIKTKHYTTSIMKVDIINREYIGEVI